MNVKDSLELADITMLTLANYDFIADSDRILNDNTIMSMLNISVAVLFGQSATIRIRP
jgi:hypothetical protein